LINKMDNIFFSNAVKTMLWQSMRAKSEKVLTRRVCIRGIATGRGAWGL
jgi:hypothetical protein